MVYKGHVENGVIVLDEDVTLPEGTTVEINSLRLPPELKNSTRHPFAGIIPVDLDLKKAYYEHLWEKHK